jgi:hypothetical protein
MTNASSQKRRAIISVVCGAGAMVVILFAHWEPRADFDVTGVLWLMQNIVPFTIVCVLFVFASGALAQCLRLRFRKDRQQGE